MQIPISQVRKSTFLAPNQSLQRAREYPLYGCWMMAGWQEKGIKPVVVAGEPDPGRVMFGVS
jgi:hypothetical protein